jgi:hypothetical protein
MACGAEEQPPRINPPSNHKPVEARPNKSRERQAASAEEVAKILKQADQMALAGKLEKADELYAQTWGILRLEDCVRTDEQAFWVLMSAVNVKFLKGEHDKAFAVAQVITKTFHRNRTMYVGNPLFHLRVGQCKLELAGEQGKRSATDELARALMGGGVEIFDGEDEKYLKLVTGVLKPPVGYKDWEASRGRGGASRNRLNGATSFVAKLLEKKLGSPPPYR